MLSDFYWFKKRYVLCCIIEVFIDSVTLSVDNDWSAVIRNLSK